MGWGSLPSALDLSLGLFSAQSPGDSGAMCSQGSWCSALPLLLSAVLGLSAFSFPVVLGEHEKRLGLCMCATCRCLDYTFLG
jgi:hypothetical protein